MPLLIHGRSGPRRRAVILLVVLSMLTLFALVGISFVLTADAQATSARIAREAEQAYRPEIEAEAAFFHFMSSLLYDVPDDSTGVFNSMRGQSLARNMYGWNPGNGVLNDKPYSGTGRLHSPATQSNTAPVQTPSRYKSGLGSTDAALMNFRFFPGDFLPTPPYGPFDFNYNPPFPPNTPYLRDPERPGFRQGLGANQLAYAGGFGVPYTYPDHNNFYLAEIDPNTGQVIVPSFHRPYLFGPLDLSPTAPPTNPVPLPANPYPFPGITANNWNPNWTNGEGKYLTLRPRPADQGGAVNGGSFPFPLDGGGDVKNLDFAPGGADSIWIDIGAPVLTAADGRKYKMLVAPLILALDGRIDLNAVGNIMGANSSHRSHQGWGTWEVNPGKILDANATEWTNLFNGSTAAGNARIRGRYDGSPRAPAGAIISGSNKVRQWAQLDYDSMDTNGAQSTGLALPRASSSTSYLGFPTFGTSFGNGGTENTNHASIFSPLRPRSPNRRIPLESAPQMLRLGGTGTDMLVSDALRLLPNNLLGNGLSDFAAVRRRNLVTLLSADLDRPGATPYLFDTSASSSTRYVLNAPVAPATVYTPSGLTTAPNTTPNNPPFPPLSSAGTAGGEFDASWRSTLAARLRLDLYRPLTAYPVPLTPGATPAATDWLMNDTAARQTQVNQATTDRQNFAKDIFITLLAVTGTPTDSLNLQKTLQTVYDTNGKSSPEFRAVRYCAQLAVNIVDYMDSDDIITPFNWANFTATNNDVVNEWVFGVETPRLVLNELYISYDNDPNSLMTVAGVQKVKMDGSYVVNVWAELHNPMPNDSQPDTTAHLSTGAGANLAYRILLADQSPNATVANAMRDPGNSLGDPDFGQPGNSPPGAIYGQAASSVRTVLDSWGDSSATGNAQSVAPGGAKFDWSADATKSNGFFVIGPKSTFVDDTQDNPNLPTTATSAKMSYTVPVANANSGTPARPTVLLQRLANPSMPLNNTMGANFNPYITVDYVRNTAAFVMDGRRFDTTGPITLDAVNANAAHRVMTLRNSVGRRQPLGAGNGQRIAQAPVFTVVVPPAKAPAAPTNQPKHTFSRQNCTFDTKAALDAAATDTTLKIPFDWMTHLDRLPNNPLELLNVGDTRPHDLTQRFVTGTGAQQHLAPWTTANARLYRFFEFVTTGFRGTGAVHPTNAGDATTDPVAGAGGRIAGKVNINAIRDVAVFRALADAQNGNTFFSSSPPMGQTSDQFVDAVYAHFVSRRGNIALNVPPGPTDQFLATLSGQPATHNPIWSLALGQATASSPPSTDPFLTTSSGTRGLENTPLQNFTVPAGGGNPATTTLLFEPNPDSQTHPYLQRELLRKIYGSVTTRSNVFAVWATVGFFECDTSTTPPRLGAEIGASENRQIRHRMFSIVDRTQLQAWPTLKRDSTGTAPAIPPTPTVFVNNAITAGSAAQAHQLSQTTVSHPLAAPLPGTTTPYQWTAQQGAVLVYEPNTDNEETVVLDANSQAVFTKSHAAGVAVIVRGNPGPLQRYDPRLDKDVVPYFALID